MHDLGDNVIPFPRELHEQFTREMIYVWEIDVGVILSLGSVKSLLAFVLENRRSRLREEQGPQGFHHGQLVT